MATKMRAVAFVPAKGDSTRIRNKNTVILDGDYLFKRKLKQLLACPEIDDVYRDAESDAIIAMASDLPVKILKRNPKLASNATDGHELFANECARVEADIYIQCLCTSPFITAETMTRATKALKASKTADSLVAVQKKKQYIWAKGRPAYGEGRIPNSVDLPDIVIESMGLYMVRRAKGKPKPKCRFGEKVEFFNLTDEEAFDVNWPDDLALAERICAGYRASHNAALDAIRPHLCSSLLADICKERGLKTLLSPGFARVSGRSVLGIAKTLELRKLKKGDSVELNGLEFSVFAKGISCDDIKYEGTVHAMNRPIKIGGVTINNGDYIYADDDGVLAIPQALWPSIRNEAMATLKKEFDIRYAIIMGEDVGKVLGTHGAF